MGRKIAQSSMEFVILVGFLMTAFAIFFLVINENLRKEINKNTDSQIKEVALTAQNEINLAYESIEGYSRNFTLPLTISGKPYTIYAKDDLLFVITNDGTHSISIPIVNVTGNITNLHSNIIIKKNGIVKIN